ncbi:MAG TPA: hypothetical protein VMR19_01635 [Candidatus Saccharimonadales bacterium]|jgi:hypothetical protein|nr:hypothetical protein [Candidatus Saccharimonadales bacterium]
MAAELAPELATKYPNLTALIGCDATAWCEITKEDCTQMVYNGGVASKWSGDNWVVESLPEKFDATGCAGCPFNTAQNPQG